MRASLALTLLLLVSGCGGAGDESDPDEVTGCAPAEWRRDDGTCVPAGLPPDMPCPPAEWLRDDGVCIPAGVPPDGCGEGFVHDGDRGCEPILPDAPCPPGQMAVPGERTCREVAPCASGKWGDIPVEPNTEYVDASYAGMDSDGSALKPWTSIQDGVVAASPGAIVAIASGSYLEDVVVSGKPVRLWGVCPALAQVVGTGAELGAIVVVAGASASEVHGLSLSGSAIGFVSSGSFDVLVERVWVHESASRGVVVQNDLGPARVILRGALVEQNYEFGVFTAGSEIALEASVVRSTRPDAQGLLGRGVSVRSHPTTGEPSTLRLQRALVEQNREVGVYAFGSDATLEASVVRTTEPNAQGLVGRGISVQLDPTTGAPTTLWLQRSLVEQNHETGVQVSGSEATLEASVVRMTYPNAQRLFGRGVNAQEDVTTGAPSILRLQRSLVAHSHEIGVSVFGSEATLEAIVVRNTEVDVQGSIGRGVEVQAHETTSEPSTLLLERSLIEQSHEAGVSVISSTATIAACFVRDTLPNAAGLFGDGIAVVSEPGSASATITATRIDESALAAVAAWGAHAAVGASVLRCQAFDLDAETFKGVDAVLEDLGGNLCGCPEASAPCKAVSANLAPPPSLAAPGDP